MKLANRLLSVGFVLCWNAAAMGANPTISAVTPNASSVGIYQKLELVVGLTGTYTNPYDPTQIDLSAQFTAPSKKTWKVNGFWDGSKWRIRFAANETGTWSYSVSATDTKGTTTPATGAFSVASSSSHGWVHVGPNKRYLAHDDGTSFYSIGAAAAWGLSTTILDQMKNLGFNTYVYWNGTYDNSGGNNLIESVASGIGKYDQPKCARVDSLVNWSESRGMGMIFVIWSHDYLASTMSGGWQNKWSLNPYQSIVSAANFYSDANAWTYQQKEYRYIIARWGYSTAIVSWQTIDEIAGTDGWSNQTAANAWAAKINTYFQANDPFNHPTTASKAPSGPDGDYWPDADAVYDLPNTEDYTDYSVKGIAAVAQKLWNNYTKPAIMGECQNSAPQSILWTGLANGLAMTPMLWQYTQTSGSGSNWSAAASAAYPPLVSFLQGIDFAAMKSPARATASLSGANAYAITSPQITFGYINGTISGKSLTLGGLPNGNATLEWWDCAKGTKLSSSKVQVSGGNLTATVPSTSSTDMGFKLQATTALEAMESASSSNSVVWRSGSLLFSQAMESGAQVEVLDLQGRRLADGRALDNRTFSVGSLPPGLLLVRVRNGAAIFTQPLLVRD